MAELPQAGCSFCHSVNSTKRPC